MELLNIQSFTYEAREGMLPLLTEAFGDCGGWILERKTLSGTTLEFRVEIQLRDVLELYAAMFGIGVELTRAGHEALALLCLRRRHLRMKAELGQVVSIRLEISFLERITIFSLLGIGAGMA